MKLSGKNPVNNISNSNKLINKYLTPGKKWPGYFLPIFFIFFPPSFPVFNYF